MKGDFFWKKCSLNVMKKNIYIRSYTYIKKCGFCLFVGQVLVKQMNKAAFYGKQVIMQSGNVLGDPVRKLVGGKGSANKGGRTALKRKQTEPGMVLLLSYMCQNPTTHCTCIDRLLESSDGAYGQVMSCRILACSLRLQGHIIVWRWMILT